MTGKLLRNVLKMLLPCVVIALENPTTEQESDFKEILTCIRYFVDFALVCRYKSHTETSIGYLLTYLNGFHRHKQVFEPFKGKGTKVPKDRKKEEELIEKALEAKRQRKHNFSVQATALLKQLSEREVIQILLPTIPEETARLKRAKDLTALIHEFAEADGSKILADHGILAFIKMHLLSHLAPTIKRFGALQ
ncbi:MAG: hypothetical protein ACE3JU_11610 [Paenibacillus sp.]|uniref:hypothetical protein n=1 Tax=Paenibacillus sp. TaxID=58172 RepID=UPI003B7733D4